MRPSSMNYGKNPGRDRQHSRFLRGIKLTRRVRRALQSFLDELVMLRIVIDNFQRIADQLNIESEQEEDDDF
ncbi:hypothetical protein AWZ03_011227 [Drosophila navojoa]|uniref:Uncharacterized protein n=1 Tax=Drosophila navojoa TaxID=7232 RepID=A0A484B0E8_DRONA|nr:hypothetical protein AWZ03_011227 [Drosophila navojoa]